MTNIIKLSNYVKREELEDALDALCDVSLQLAKLIEVKSERLLEEVEGERA